MIDIDWGSFAAVAATSFTAAVAIVVLFALGLRLLATGAPDDAGDSAPPVRSSARPAAATFGAWACIVLATLSVLYGLYLLIPQFHA